MTTATPARRDGGTALGIIAAAVAVLVFTAFTLVSRWGAVTHAGPADLAALRFGVGGVLLAPFLLSAPVRAVGWRRAVVLALVGGTVFAGFAYGGLALAPASHGAVLLHGALPVFGLVSGALVLGERPSRQRLAGAALILAGILTVAAGTGALQELRRLVGDGLLLGGSFCWTLFGALVRRWSIAPLTAAVVVTPLSAVLFLPVYLLVLDGSLAALAPRDLVIQGIVQGVLMGIASPVLYMVAVSRFGATETALSTAVIPGLTTAGAVLFLGEAVGAANWIGVILATAGMVVSFRPDRPRRAALADFCRLSDHHLRDIGVDPATLRPHRRGSP